MRDRAAPDRSYSPRSPSARAVDSLTNELTDKAFVPHGFLLALDIEPGIEAIVDESFALAPFHGFARGVVAEPFALQVPPEPRLRQALACEQRERHRVSPPSH
jgi:hypothetical protein